MYRDDYVGYVVLMTL